MKPSAQDKKLHKAVPKAAKLLKALAHRERLLILCQLSVGEKNVGKLLEHSALSQSAFSQHLSILRKQKIIKARKDQQNIYYSLSNNDADLIIKLLHQIYC